MPSAPATTTSSASASLPRTLRNGFIYGMDSRVAEAVADAAHGEDRVGPVRVRLDLLAQMPDVDVDRARVAEVGGPPQRLEQHAAAVDAARVRHQRPQQLELDVGELRPLAAHLDRAARHVDQQ